MLSRIKRKYWILVIVSIAVIVLDQVTKLEVLARFRLNESISIIPDYFNFTYIRNTGAAFGILADADPRFRVPFFLIIPVVALLIIGSIFRKLPDHSLLVSNALALVMGGAVGNLIDRARLGYVVDFLDFHWQYKHHFPAFNIADSAICVGVALLIIDLLFYQEAEQREEPRASSSV